MTKRNNNYNNESIKSNVLGMAGNLAIATNAGWNSEYVVVYTIPNKDWKSDDDFKNLVFGRVSTNNAFKADKLAVVNLSKYYSDYLIDFVISLEELEGIAKENNTNLGIAMEIALVKAGLFRKASPKQDKRGIDLICAKTGKLYQLKTSVVKAGSHGSAGVTNKSAKCK